MDGYEPCSGRRNLYHADRLYLYATAATAALTQALFGAVSRWAAATAAAETIAHLRDWNNGPAFGAHGIAENGLHVSAGSKPLLDAIEILLKVHTR